MSDFTIDEIVNIIIEKLKYPEDFKEERKELILSSSFYLSEITENLDIYSEADLILLSFATEIQFLLPLYISCFKLPHSIDKMNLKELIEHPKSSLDYTTGKVNEVKNYISRVKGYRKIQKRRVIRENEVEENYDEFYLYEGKYRHSYDLDGLSGVIPPLCLNPFLLNVFIKIDISENPQPINKKSIKKDFYCVRLGFVYSCLGPISIYLFNPDQLSLDQFIVNISLMAGVKLELNTKKFEYVLGYDELEEFFTCIREVYELSGIYIESFGCKVGFSSSSIEKVLINLENTIKKEVIPGLLIDIASSIIPEENVIIFPSSKVFNKLNIEPNFILGCCNRMGNFHSHLVSEDVFNYGCIWKMNFYSILEDSLFLFRKESFLPSHALLKAQTNFEGLSFSKQVSFGFDKKIEILQENILRSQRCGYRLELTVRGVEVGTAYNILHSITEGNSRSFICLDCTVFSRKFISNIIFLANHIQGSTFKDLIKGIVAEFVLKEIYLKGSLNKHYMPSNFNINLRKNSIPVFDNNFIISQSKFEDNGITMMKKLLQSKIYFLKAEFKDFLQSYISILESLCIENCIEIVYRQYTSDYLKFYGLEKTDFVLNFNLLNEEEKKMIDLNEHSISLNYFIQDVFFLI